jgi:hypothetical protein
MSYNNRYSHHYHRGLIQFAGISLVAFGSFLSFVRINITANNNAIASADEGSQFIM